MKTHLNPSHPFRILVIGDFSGRENRKLQESLLGRRALTVDCDNLEERLTKLDVAVDLSFHGSREDTLPLSFRELEDFHPDSLYKSLPSFKKLRSLRRDLLNPARFPHAAAEVQGWARQGSRDISQDAPPSVSPDQEPTATQEDTMAQLLDQPVKAKARPHVTVSSYPGLHTILKKLVAPYIVPGPDPRQEELVTAVDQATSELMRAILHDRDFMRLEATWRSLDFLIRRLETDENLAVCMLDTSRDELISDLDASEDISKTQLHRILVEETVQTPGGIPWSVVVGLQTFDDTEEDVRLLRRLGLVAAAARTTYIAASDYSQWQAAKGRTSPAWKELRGSREADYLALATPGILLRLPYGPDTDAVESFEFEELPIPPTQDDYLWGNSAIASACLLGQTFRHAGWSMRPGAMNQLEDLPLHVYKVEDEETMTPPTRYRLSETDAEGLANAGLIPLLWVKGQNALRVYRFQSMAGHALPIG